MDTMPYLRVLIPDTLQRFLNHQSRHDSANDTTKAGNVVVEESEVFSLQDGHTRVSFEKQAKHLSPGKLRYLEHGWKPPTMRAPVLGFFMTFSILVVVLLELLFHISSGKNNANGGGLAFAADVDSISAVASFGYLYLPTVISVAYSMLWSWVDLDVKRIEPWLQLSKTTGATAKDSLLLQYPFDFLPLVPITAARRRHWGVFLAGTVMLLIFWIVTPLQSAIFNTGTVLRTRNESMIDSAFILPLSNQTKLLNANFLNTGYGISWLSQSLPPFTTRDYAVVPYTMVNKNTLLPEETWTTTSNAYFTNLTCTPARMSQHVLGYTFDNGKGCVVADVVLADTGSLGKYMINYIGYYNSPLLDWSLQNPNCSSEFSNNFLAVFATASSRISSGVYENLTALFCEPSYNVQSTYITINASNNAIISGLATDEGSLGISDIFNTTNFEMVLGIGTSDTQANYPDSEVLEQYPRLESYNITWPFSNMVGFAVALSNVSIDQLAEPTILARSFEKAHQLLFGVALSSMTRPSSDESSNLRTGIRCNSLGAIILVRDISIIVEATLLIVTVLVGSLWVYSKRRTSLLVEDPASIQDTMSLLWDRNRLIDDFKDDGTLTDLQLQQRLSMRAFRLESNILDHSSPRLECITTSDTAHNHQDANRIPSPKPGKEDFLPVRPRELRLTTAMLFGSSLLMMIGAITFLQIWSTRSNGITPPTANSTILSLLENYLPTTFASFIEPMWVILARLLCLLQPFEDMRDGNAKRTSSVNVKYTSLPPQLVIWRAIRAGHFLLAAICIISISTNILAIALSALIVERPVRVLLNSTSFQTILPQLNGNSIRTEGLGGPSITYSDHFYVALSNLTDSTLLPSWVDQHYYYIPFDLQSLSQESDIAANGLSTTEAYRAITTGFGTQVDCSQMSDSGSDSVLFRPADSRLSAKFLTTHELKNGTLIDCYPHANGDISNQTTGFTANLPSGLLAMEVMQTMTSANIPDDGYCESLIVAGWARFDFRGTNPDAGKSVDSLFLACTQSLVTGDFEVDVDIEGHVLSSRLLGDLSFDDPSFFIGNATRSSLFRQSSSLIAPQTTGDFVWHNESFTSDWMNSLLQYNASLSQLVAPSNVLPDAIVLESNMEQLCTQLFAILIGLNNHIFARAEISQPLIAQKIVLQSRIFISSLGFKLTVSILSIHVIMVIVYYSKRPRRFLPRMPTSVASVISYVIASRIIPAGPRLQGPYRSKGPEYRFAYGRFVGPDNKIHVGIEEHRYVIPLESKNPMATRRKWWSIRRRDEKELQTWI